jgi:Rha family phage regulatory protein
MNELTVIKLNSGHYIDSREVAGVIGKQHKHLLRDIRGYCEILEKSTGTKIGLCDFFIESTYFDSTGRELPCFLMSKMACELVANKLTGEKGVLFTALYVAKFNEMEAIERAESAAVRVPRLGEYNAAARIIVRAMKSFGASPEQILEFLRDVYEPLGISVTIDDTDETKPRMYTAKEIAEYHGVYSLNGNPHAQAVSCVLNEHIVIGESHKTVLTSDYGNHIGVSVLYDEYASDAVYDWLSANDFPREIESDYRTYHVLYSY